MKLPREWTETHHRDGSVQYKLQCPLLRGEHRPTVYLSATGTAYATAISGYHRPFATLAEALHWAGRVPMQAGGFTRDAR